MLSPNRLSIVLSVIFIASLGTSTLQSQSKNSSVKLSAGLQSESDYKIISSGESYVELEFYPHYSNETPITINGSTFNALNIGGTFTVNPTDAGSPEVKCRGFSVFLPGKINNTVSITDYESEEIKNFRLAPVGKYSVIDPRKTGFENMAMQYSVNQSSYSKNKSLPDITAELINIEDFRDLVKGTLRIYPYKYNPAASVLIKYTRIRVRITFGSKPFRLTKPRTRAEAELLSDAAINSNTALGWTNAGNNFRAINPVFNSVMSSGDWYKIEIKDNGSGGSEGIYKITKSFLQSAGININSIDPRTIKMYGNGGYLLPDSIYPDRAIDLQPIPIYIEGENDGHFDAQDYILFYGRSINNWKYDYTGSRYYHYISPYSTSNFYWICLNTPGSGERMQILPSENSPNPVIINSFREKIFFEPELSNLIMEGNLWLSERESPGYSFTWNTTLTGLEANSDIIYKSKPAARVINPIIGPCPYYVNFLLRDEASNMADYVIHLSCVMPGFENWISTDTGSFVLNASQKVPPNSEQVRFRAEFSTNSPDGEGYLDWDEIEYMRRLNSAAGDALRFDSPNTEGIIEYNVSSFSGNDVRAFDITDNNHVKRIQPLSASAGNVKFQKTQTLNNLSRFIVTGPGGYKTPQSITERVPNQNLHGISDGASFIIITHPDFLSAANSLKARREAGGPANLNYLKTLIFTCDQIYNEFSGGVQDPVAIRDFIKNSYENWQEKPVFVLLLGDGDIDYKHILVNNKNWVPPYEISSPQINQVDGYPSDDFFVNVTGNEIPNSAPEMSVGRIPARSPEDVQNYLDKIDCYEDFSNNGYWKNKMVFVADDAHTSDGCEGNIHIPASESLTANAVPPNIDQYKIYLPLYPTVITAQGRRKPECNADIIKKWNEGCLDIHYIGHGSPEVWSHEYIFEKDIVLSEIHNRCIYPFVTNASCDMSKYDNPLSQSAAELLVMAPNKGAIGTLAASRPVYSGYNNTLMEVFFNHLYRQRDTLLLPRRFGGALFDTKQTLFGVNDLKFVLLGDPTIRVRIPRFASRVDSISGLSNDTLKALSRVKIYGSILNPDSTIWTAYNGKINLKLFDVQKDISITDECATYEFVLQGGLIYSGSQNIRNGLWTMEFVVPKDISYRNKRGKMIDYFYNNESDGAGMFDNFIIGGINPNAVPDTTGPQVSLYLNSRNFRSGDVVNNNFKLIADLSDESGINTTGTIGHKLEAELDNNPKIVYDLSSFYNSDTTYKSGSVEYDLQNIPDGKHVLSLRAWDTYNNSSTAKIDFTAANTGALNIMNVYNYPNPFKDKTSFTFQHNYPGMINVRIKIYTISGRLIKEIKRDYLTEKFVMIDWAATDEDGDALSNGIYLYKLIVNAEDGSTKTTIGKLAVLK